MKYNIMNKNKKNAFSLVEVLISLVLISLVMVAMAPIMTKKTVNKTNEGIVYTYNQNNNTTEDNVCFITDLSNFSSHTEQYVSTRECSEYQFTVPNGVFKINLTLVAGGGGGGGAAGGKTETKTISTQGALVSHSNAQGFKPDILKSVMIKTLVSKGQSGKSTNTDCNSGDSKCGGKGGNSSIAFMNFKLPKNYIRGFNFTNSLNTPSILNGKIATEAGINPYISVITSTNTSFDEANKIEYGIEYSDSGYKPYCYLGSQKVDMTASGSSKCGIAPPYIIDSINGDFGRGENDETTIYADSNGAIFAGGTGGMVKGASVFGSGGTGAYLKLVCPDGPTKQCLVKNATYSTAKSQTEGGGAYSEVEYTVEYPAGAGGGGAGGSGARIIGLSVLPGETYTIRVGSGGVGGKGGVASDNPVAGGNGTGGVSSAIYDSNDNLIYMVNGGAPGEGGKVYNGALYAGAMGNSGRFAPKVISGNVDLINNIALDKNVSETVNSNIGSKPSRAGNNNALSSINISYPYNNAEPFHTLNNRTNENTISVDTRTGGFSGFDTQAAQNSNTTYNGTNISSAYDGLYYRNLIDNYGAYIGGLGGFSAVSQKAGCGAFFIGNFDGRTAYSNNANLINKFLIDNDAYSVSKYYTNCSIDSPNGKSTEFVNPRPNSSDLGSAGAGGGGGGYHIKLGSGNGGNGQNGYVMIEWRE